MALHLKTVNVRHHKLTAEKETVIMPYSCNLVIPMLQHIGRPCVPTVKVGDSVLKGQIIGEATEFMSAPIHASTSGKVVSVRDMLCPSGVYTPHIEIAPDKEDKSIEPLSFKIDSLSDLVDATRQLGMVGLGGAGFPTSIKLNPKNIDEVDTLIVNATECEPFITSDYREMLENAEDIKEGIELLKKLMNIKNAYIGIEDNKPKAIEIMKKLSGDIFEVKTLKSRYPQGAEKVIIYHLTGRKVLEGQLPADVGVVVINVTSLGSLMRGLKTGLPLTHKRVTVSGDCVKQPQNVYAPIGTPIDKIIEFCGGVVNEPEKLIMGGPMMGVTMCHGSMPIIKNTNAVLLLSKKLADTPEPTACIRCSKCVSACPFNLMPTVFEHAYHDGDLEALEKHKVMLCMECGCCSFVCPAKRPLVQTNRLAKAALREKK